MFQTEYEFTLPMGFVDAEGNLPEQVPTRAYAPAMLPVWERRWGPVATPLLWSHAMYLILANELGDRAG